MMDEDWNVLTSLFPADWRELARTTGALKGLRKNKSEEALLRTMLMHLGCGYSLRETAVRAREAGLADMSDVALFKRLKKCKGWFYAMCRSLFEQRGTVLKGISGRPVRMFDATHVCEPGKTGSVWRVHYSIEAPSLRCDFFSVTATQGKGTGESFRQFPIEAGDLILADRGYSLASGIEYVDAAKAFVTVRLNPQSTQLIGANGNKFDLRRRLKTIERAGSERSWPASVAVRGAARVAGRICAVRKSEEAIRQSLRKLERRANKNGQKLKPETRLYAEYVILFTTFPEEEFTTQSLLEWYRLRWQIELVFKRFKQIANLGHLPKHDDDSAQAWLYGKLFIALVTEKLIGHAQSFSPWGYHLGAAQNPEPVA